jgi:hypothetical protein
LINTEFAAKPAWPVEGVLADKQKPPPKGRGTLHGQDRLQRLQPPGEKRPLERPAVPVRPVRHRKPICHRQVFGDGREVGILNVVDQVRFVAQGCGAVRRIGVEFVEEFQHRRIECLPAPVYTV